MGHPGGAGWKTVSAAIRGDGGNTSETPGGDGADDVLGSLPATALEGLMNHEGMSRQFSPH